MQTEQRDDRGGLPSASSMDRIVHCAGCLTAERGLSDLPVEEVTEDGTDIHDSMETGDDSELGMDQKDIAENLRRAEERELSNWRVACNIAADAPILCIREGGDDGRFWIRDRSTLEPYASARPDVVYAYNQFGLVINYKTGYGKMTPSEKNWQSRCEVVSTRHEMPSLEWIRGAILQSRLSTHFDATDYNTEALDLMEQQLRFYTLRAKQPDAPRTPGPWCRWCKAQGLCKENAAWAMIPHVGIPPAKDKGDSLAIVQAVERMTPKELGFVYERKSVIEAVFKTIKHRLSNLSDAQLAEAGYKRAPGRTTYPIEDTPKAFDTLLQVLNEEERKLVIKISRDKVETILREKQNLKKDQAKEKVIALLGLQPVQGDPLLKPL